jgi:hypothetical protein
MSFLPSGRLWSSASQNPDYANKIKNQGNKKEKKKEKKIGKFEGNFFIKILVKE